MESNIRVTTIVENTAGLSDVLGEHGLAFWIEAGGYRVLFDTGQGGVLAGNAGALGIPLRDADAIVVSHGHYDHTGGLLDAVRLAGGATVFIHPDAFRAKYSRSGGTSRYIGMRGAREEDLREAAREMVLTREPARVCPGVWVTGEIPRLAEFEDTGGPFFGDERGEEPDPLADDQALFLETGRGVVVLLGCAHAGVVNTIRHVARLAVGARILAVIGGMHLGRASEERLERTVAAFRELGVAHLGPAHCTGPAATARLMHEFPDRCTPSAAGTVWSFPPP